MAKMPVQKQTLNTARDAQKQDLGELLTVVMLSCLIFGKVMWALHYAAFDYI